MSADIVAFNASSGAGVATLDVNASILTLSLGAFAGTLAFGSNSISVGGTGTVFQGDSTYSVTGTPVINVTSTGSTAITVSPYLVTEANSISFNFTGGTYALSLLDTIAGNAVKNLDFTGFSGTWLGRTYACTIYGNLTISTGMSLAASTPIVSFRATSGTQVITSNAKTIDFPLTANGVGGTVQLSDALLMGATRTLTHTNGTIDLNGKTLTVGTRYTTAAGTKNLTFNGGTLVCPNANTSSFNNAGPTNFTTTAGTGTGKISMTAATAKTFVGGGSTFNCTLSNDGAGALTVSGSNTFTTVANGVQPTAFTFTAATTQTVTNWNVSGTAGNLVTIISGTAGVPALLSKASGTVSSDYLSLKDSTATGGATWYAGANSTNVSGNLGWIFSAAPVDVSVSVTGVSSTGSVGTAIITVDANANLTGLASTSAVGSVAAGPTQDAIVAFEGWNRSQGWGLGPFGSGSIDIGVSTGQVGSVSIISNVDVTVNLTGVEATGATGTATVTIDIDVSLTGVSATGVVGDSSITADANVSPTGVEATGAVGTLIVTADANVSPTGVAGTGAVGDVTLVYSANVSPTGISATGSVGTSTVTADANVSPTGVSATGSVGTLTVTADANVSPTGVEAIGAVGTATATADANVNTTGVSATGSVGSVAVAFPIDVFPTGVSGTGSVGTVSIVIDIYVSVAGISATGYVGPVLVWGQIVPNQDPNWTQVSPAQSPAWSPVSPSQDPGWTPIAA